MARCSVGGISRRQWTFSSGAERIGNADVLEGADSDRLCRVGVVLTEYRLDGLGWAVTGFAEAIDVVVVRMRKAISGRTIVRQPHAG